MPKKINHEQRMKEILRESLELFSSKGYEATTLADIAKAAHIARPTLYQYFRNKHQILFFASKQFTDEFLIYYQKILQMRHIPPLYRLRFILSHIVLSCREKRRELVSQSAFILKLEKEGRSIGELVHKRTKPLKNLLCNLLAEAGLLKNKADLLLTMVTSGIVHVLLFPSEDCAQILQHIATILDLLSGTRTDSTAYAKIYQNLLQQIEQMRTHNALAKAEQSANKIIEAANNDLDEEWSAILDPFRALE